MSGRSLGGLRGSSSAPPWFSPEPPLPPDSRKFNLFSTLFSYRPPESYMFSAGISYLFYYYLGGEVPITPANIGVCSGFYDYYGDLLLFYTLFSSMI